MNNLISPLAHFWIYLLFALIAYLLNHKKLAKILAIGAFIVLFIFTISPWPIYMVRDLEQRYPIYSPVTADSTLNVLVLGAAHVNDPQLPALQRLSIPVLDRVTEGIRLQEILKGKIVFSGFSRANNSPHALAMAQAAVSLGANPTDTLMLVKPRNTWEEAAAYKKRFGADKKFILVTSAIHMPRAMEIFKDMGMNPIPAPANFINRNEPEANPYHWWPSSIKSMYTEIAMYEYVSTWYYKWKVKK
jgi:uncharacterized SAM-binding protein YcdF (DUF218 family)